MKSQTSKKYEFVVRLKIVELNCGEFVLFVVDFCKLNLDLCFNMAESIEEMKDVELALTEESKIELEIGHLVYEYVKGDLICLPYFAVKFAKEPLIKNVVIEKYCCKKNILDALIGCAKYGEVKDLELDVKNVKCLISAGKFFGVFITGDVLAGWFDTAIPTFSISGLRLLVNEMQCDIVNDAFEIYMVNMRKDYDDVCSKLKFTHYGMQRFAYDVMISKHLYCQAFSFVINDLNVKDRRIRLNMPTNVIEDYNKICDMAKNDERNWKFGPWLELFKMYDANVNQSNIKHREVFMLEFTLDVILCGLMKMVEEIGDVHIQINEHNLLKINLETVTMLMMRLLLEASSLPGESEFKRDFTDILPYIQRLDVSCVESLVSRIIEYRSEYVSKKFKVRDDDSEMVVRCKQRSLESFFLMFKGCIEIICETQSSYLVDNFEILFYMLEVDDCSDNVEFIKRCMLNQNKCCRKDLRQMCGVLIKYFQDRWVADKHFAYRNICFEFAAVKPEVIVLGGGCRK